MKITRDFQKLYILFFIVPFLSCSALRQNANEALPCAYRIVTIKNFRLMGHDLKDVAATDDFSVPQALTLSGGYGKKQMPATFDLILGVKNPNNGLDGKPKVKGILAHMPWTFWVDQSKTVSGNLEEIYHIPETSQEILIPLHIEMNMAEFFFPKGYAFILKLALEMSQNDDHLNRFSLVAKPTIETHLGSIRSKEEIFIQAKIN